MSGSVAEQQNEIVKERMADIGVQCPAWVKVDRSCGCVQWIPAPCSDPCCQFCQKVWADRMRERWFPVLEGMKRPKLITLTIPSSHDLADRVDHEAQSFRRFLDCRLGPRNWSRFKVLSADFLAAHLDENEPSDLVRKERYTNGLKSLDTFGRDLARFERNEGRSARVRDVVGPGFSSREVTYNSGPGWHLHRHLTVDSWFIPWHLLAVVWQHVSGGSVVDIRAVSRDRKGMLECVKYLSKHWEIPEGKQYEVRQALKGLKKVWPLGGAKPEPIDHTCPGCECPDCQVEQYRLGQTMHKWTGEDGRDRMSVLLYGVFDEADQWVTLVRVDGSWCEVGPYLDKHGVCVPEQRNKAGPDPPETTLTADPVSVEQYGLWLDDVWN